MAALDLGTNNCRLLIATPAGRGGFRVVEAYSRIVRLGEGLTPVRAAVRGGHGARAGGPEGQRREAAPPPGASRLRAIATQACRMAENGPEFIDRVAEETGLRLQIITPQEEARLSVAGCLNLLDRSADAALVVDVGGGSTELSWVDLQRRAGPPATPPLQRLALDADRRGDPGRAVPGGRDGHRGLVPRHGRDGEGRDRRLPRAPTACARCSTPTAPT